MISKYTNKHVDKKEAFHKGCGGLVRPLFDMLVCDKCRKTLDDDSQMAFRLSPIWSLSRRV